MASLSRTENLDRLRAGETWDVLVIGGGATGLGTAVDAAARGYRTLLVEAHDFAQGTSSRSTKLVHGGVRYLAQGNIPLVREALHERSLLLQNAPHLVHARDFVVPALHYWELPYYATGLWLYDRLAGRLSLARSRWVSRAEVIARVSTIRRAGLRGGIVYTDGQFDDARLAISLARTLVDLEGSALNHFPVTALLKHSGKIKGALARDDETSEEFSISARAVVNATGVFADDVRHMDDPGAPSLLAPSQGAHIVLDQSFLPGETALMVPKTDDGRVLFAIPWSGRVIVGTTDIPMAHLPIEPKPLDMEIDYLLNHAGRYLDRQPSRADIKSKFAGMRPLFRPDGSRGTATAKLSREHVVVVSDSGLVTITGGKWTTYRRMGRDAVDHAARVGGLPGRPCATASLKLHGWGQSQDLNHSHLRVYGSDLANLQNLLGTNPEWSEPIHPALPYLGGEAIWAIRHEAARSIEDVLTRRTRSLFLDASASLKAAPRVAALAAQELKRDQAWQDDQVARFQRLAEDYGADRR
jgi:glycerol-3-phosphate dehydrogenase